MEISYFGHACFGIKIHEKFLLFDPFISPNPAAASINIDEINADYILLSHGHKDHVADISKIYKSGNPLVISNFEIISWLATQGIENGHPMNHGGSKVFDFGTVKMVNAVHSSSLPDGSYGGNPVGFVISMENTCFYFAGDTALTYDMKLISEEFSIDIAFLPIGDNFTMGIDDAVKAAKFVGSEKIIGMHYDTFPMIEINHEVAIRKFNEQGLELLLLSIGETKIV